MTILVYILAIVVSFLVGGMAAWIPLTIMHAKSGNKSSLWEPDPGNERRFFTVHRLGQGIGALATTLVSLLSTLWVFSWFDRRPHIAFLILLGIWNAISVLGAKAHLMPMSQAKGAALGAVIFFVYYTNWN